MRPRFYLLRNSVADRELSCSQPSPRTPSPAPAQKRHRPSARRRPISWTSYSLAAVVLTLALGAGFLLLGPSKQGDAPSSSAGLCHSVLDQLQQLVDDQRSLDRPKERYEARAAALQLQVQEGTQRAGALQHELHEATAETRQLQAQLQAEQQRSAGLADQASQLKAAEKQLASLPGLEQELASLQSQLKQQRDSNQPAGDASAEAALQACADHLRGLKASRSLRHTPPHLCFLMTSVPADRAQPAAHHSRPSGNSCPGLQHRPVQAPVRTSPSC